ncbi:MAG: DUF1926 domain-containing protein [Anaerolineae bacterium]
MAKKVYLSLVFHNHQPVGNFDHVFQEAYEKSYLPLVESLEKHPKVHVAMHFSGPLRDWILDHQPVLYDRLGSLVERGQLEMVSGAYYEPILVMLEDGDKIGQIERLNQAIQDDFDVLPEGLWLAERVWEPYLAKPIAQAGLRYVIVDDTHFQFAGFKGSDLYGYYVTEEQGYGVALVPSQKEMRYRLPWNEVDEVVDFLRSIHADPTTPERPLMVMGDDGEKFGLWPGTYERCWQNGYMERLFTALEAASDWLETITPGRYVQQFPSLGRAYLPTASYLEMTEWALPAESGAELSEVRRMLAEDIARVNLTNDLDTGERLVAINRFLRGGFWRNFLVKYPEANHMQKRGMYTSRRARQLPEGPLRRKALSHVWAAQCNCAYWHGWFGGVYLFHIRAANYKNLLEAEALILDDKVYVEQLDFDLDGLGELVINSQPFSFVVDLAHGGAVLEWDDIPSRYNLLNIMTRRTESYHLRLHQAAEKGLLITPESPDWTNPTPPANTIRAKEPGIEKKIIVDQHQHGMLIDHFIDSKVTHDVFSRAEYREMGDFVHRPYTASIEGSGTEQAVVTLTRAGSVRVNDTTQPVQIEKRLTLAHGKRRLDVDYTLTTTAETPLTLRFAIEVPFGFDGGDSHLCYFDLEDINGREIKGNLGQVGCYNDVDEYYVGSRIRGFEVQIALNTNVELWRFPLDTVTNSESGFERVHQGAVFLHVFNNVELKAGEPWTVHLAFEIEDITV